MKIFRNAILLVISLVLSFILSGGFYQKLYSLVFGSLSDGFGYESIGQFFVIFALTYILLTVLLFAAFGDAKKYWWIVVLLIPAAVFEIYFDWQHIYIPIILGLAGWAIGYGVSKLVEKSKAA